MRQHLSDAPSVLNHSQRQSYQLWVQSDQTSHCLQRSKDTTMKASCKATQLNREITHHVQNVTAAHCVASHHGNDRLRQSTDLNLRILQATRDA